MTIMFIILIISLLVSSMMNIQYEINLSKKTVECSKVELELLDVMKILLKHDVISGEEYQAYLTRKNKHYGIIK